MQHMKCWPLLNLPTIQISFSHSYSVFHIPYSLYRIPYSLFRIPYSVSVKHFSRFPISFWWILDNSFQLEQHPLTDKEQSLFIKLGRIFTTFTHTNIEEYREHMDTTLADLIIVGICILIKTPADILLLSLSLSLFLSMCFFSFFWFLVFIITPLNPS